MEKLPDCYSGCQTRDGPRDGKLIWVIKKKHQKIFSIVCFLTLVFFAHYERSFPISIKNISVIVFRLRFTQMKVFYILTIQLNWRLLEFFFKRNHIACLFFPKQKVLFWKFLTSLLVGFDGKNLFYFWRETERIWSIFSKYFIFNFKYIFSRKAYKGVFHVIFHLTLTCSQLFFKVLNLILIRDIFKEKKLQTECFVVQDSNRQSLNQPKKFLLHLTCPNCNIPMLGKIMVFLILAK